jgi:Glycosyl hydrolase family 79 C-terminal beta domain
MRLRKARKASRALKNLYPQPACFDIATYEGLQMRIAPIARVCSGLLCGSLILITGCGVRWSQSLASLTVTATPSTLSVGGAAVLRAVAHLSDGTTQDVTAGTQWTLSNSALARITNGALTATSAGTVTVRAAYVETTPAGNSPAAADMSPENLSASTQVTITAAPSTNTPLITWNAPAAITYGAALSSTQLDATANVPGTFVYSPAAGTVLKAGTQTLSVVFTPTDTKTYSSGTATVQLSVTQATPTISWAAPASIVQGTALSSLQLDATANVPGSFSYSPAAGAVPAAGTLQLSATFTPTDTIDYMPATAHNVIDVVSPASLANVGIGATPGIAIPATFMGLSHEWGTAQALMGDSTTGIDNVYRQLLQNLMAFGSGPIHLRIGGDSTDKTGEPTSTTAQPFAELANALGVKFSLGVNLGSDNVNLAVDQAKAYVGQMPPGSLDAVEIGNEPDLYAQNGMRPFPYSYQDYVADFNTWKTNIMPILPTGTNLMGPSCAGTGWLPNTQSYDSAEAGALTTFSQHYYVANGMANNPDDILLTPSASTSDPNEVSAAVVTTHLYGIPFRMGEINSLYNGGEPGISNAFESALWAVDTMFEYANVGVDGVNWHGGGGSAYTYFDIQAAQAEGASTFTLTAVNPLYYGLLFFQAATGNGAHLLPVALSTQANLKAWATIDRSGTTRLVLLNKDENSWGVVDITLSGYSHAQIYRLTAPSYLSTSGVTFAGQTFDGSMNGIIQGTQTIESVDASDGVFEVPMPITSAALVIFTK